LAATFDSIGAEVHHVHGRQRTYTSRRFRQTIPPPQTSRFQPGMEGSTLFRASEKHGFLYGFFLPVDTHKSWPYSNKVGFTNHGFFQAPPASKRIEFLLRFFIRIQSHAPNFFRIREVESKCKALVRDTLGP
jgi:hypothetical protein